jgi:hypothetical protein
MRHIGAVVSLSELKFWAIVGARTTVRRARNNSV